MGESMRMYELVTIPATSSLLPGMLPSVTSQALSRLFREKHSIRWIVLRFVTNHLVPVNLLTSFVL